MAQCVGRNVLPYSFVECRELQKNTPIAPQQDEMFAQARSRQADAKMTTLNMSPCHIIAHDCTPLPQAKMSRHLDDENEIHSHDVNIYLHVGISEKTGKCLRKDSMKLTVNVEVMTMITHVRNTPEEM